MKAKKRGWGSQANAWLPHHDGVKDAKKEEMAPFSKRVRRLADSKGLLAVETTTSSSLPQSAQATKWSQNPELSHRRLSRLRPKGRGPIQDGQKRAAGKTLLRRREIWNSALEEGTRSRKRQRHCGLGALKLSANEIETLPIERLVARILMQMTPKQYEL